jgi:hypothetical protein
MRVRKDHECKKKQDSLRVISGFHRSIDNICALPFIAEAAQCAFKEIAIFSI